MSDEANLMHMLAALVFGYLLGSIPFGLIFTRMAGLGDVRKIGSGNIGATNVLRTGRKGLAAATLVADALNRLPAMTSSVPAWRSAGRSGRILSSSSARGAVQDSPAWRK